MILGCVNSIIKRAIYALAFLYQVSFSYLKFEIKYGIPGVLLLPDSTIYDGLNGGLVPEPRRLFPCYNLFEAEINFEGYDCHIQWKCI